MLNPIKIWNKYIAGILLEIYFVNFGPLCIKYATIRFIVIFGKYWQMNGVMKSA